MKQQYKILDVEEFTNTSLCNGKYMILNERYEAEYMHFAT